MEQENIRDIPPQRLDVTTSTNPFGVGNTTYQIDCGMTIKEILEYSCPDLIKFCPVVFIDDHKIDPRYYHLIRPKAGNIISIKVAPQGGGGGGGKNPLKTVLSIALLAAAPQLAVGILGQGLAGTAVLGGLTFGKLFTAGIGVVGNLLINALVPPAKPKIPSFQNTGGGNREDISQTYFIQGARNKLQPFGSVPEVLGTHRIVPPLGSQTYTEVSADVIFSRQLFCLSLGKINVSDEKIGDTLLSEFEDVEVEDFFDGNSTDESTIYPSVVTQNSLNIELERGAAFQVRTTSLETTEVDIELTFPLGLIFYTSKGKKRAKEVTFEIRYAPTGTSNYVTEQFSEIRSTTAAFAISKRFTLAEGQYDFEVRNTSEDSGDVKRARGEQRVRDQIDWTAIRSFKNANPVNFDGASLKTIRIRGTKQLNGAIDEYNCIASRKIEDWDGASWVADQVTSNPASIFRHILNSSFSKTAIADSKIDLTAVQDWHDFCASKNLTYDAYIDYDADRESLLQEVAAAGLAVPTIVDNKYSVVVDKAKTEIVQHISQRKSFNYSYEKSFREQAHAFRIPFLNKNKDYLKDEIIVYDDGYDSTNATRFETIDFPGVVTPEANYVLGRHRLAEVRLRPDMHKVTMDIENLVATKGDRVKFSHDVSLIGLFTGRVLSLQTSGSNITGVTVDENITMEADKTYSFEFWLASGSSLTVAATTSAGTATTISFAAVIPISSGPSVGDLFSFGESSSVTIDALIHSIQPLPDYTAEVKLIDYAPGVFTASDGAIPIYNNNITVPPEFTQPLPPQLVSIQSDETVQIRNIDGSISNRMVINLINRNPFPVEPIVFIRQVGDTDYSPAATVQRDESTVILEGLDQGNVYDIEVRYRRTSGSELSNNRTSLPLLINGETFIGESNPPPDVENLNITVRTDTAYLTWDAVTVIDIDHYEVRFQNVTSGAAWPSGIPIDSNIAKESTSIPIPNAIGTYMIKAVDRDGNFSENPTLAVTTIGKILGINLVTTIDESSWGGTFDGTVDDSGSLKLGGADNIDDWVLIDDIESWDYGEVSVQSGGVYYFENTQDLGAVYDCVLQASLTVTGENLLDLVDEWDEIDGREDWDGVSPDQYSVSLQVRTTQTNPNATPVWTDWTPLRPLGEYTARGFEFRLVLTANVQDITPVISAATVTIDMPDRFESDDDISSGTGGLTVSFDNPFRAAPVVEVTADNLQTGDYFTKSNVTTDGFDIEFFDSTNTSVDRTFSYIARGYGRKVT